MNLRKLKNKFTDDNEQGTNVIRLKSGLKKELHHTITDYVEANGDTEDKINFNKISKGYSGLKAGGVYDKSSKHRKQSMDRDQPIDVYHEV
jgi:hypothetical protein